MLHYAALLGQRLFYVYIQKQWNSSKFSFKSDTAFLKSSKIKNRASVVKAALIIIQILKQNK